jgi:hypothetical protein
MFPCSLQIFPCSLRMFPCLLRMLPCSLRMFPCSLWLFARLAQLFGTVDCEYRVMEYCTLYSSLRCWREDVVSVTSWTEYLVEVIALKKCSTTGRTSSVLWVLQSTIVSSSKYLCFLFFYIMMYSRLYNRRETTWQKDQNTHWVWYRPSISSIHRCYLWWWYSTDVKTCFHTNSIWRMGFSHGCHQW